MEALPQHRALSRTVKAIKRSDKALPFEASAFLGSHGHLITSDTDTVWLNRQLLANVQLWLSFQKL